MQRDIEATAYEPYVEYDLLGLLAKKCGYISTFTIQTQRQDSLMATKWQNDRSNGFSDLHTQETHRRYNLTRKKKKTRWIFRRWR